MPCNFRWWCETMHEQITHFRETATESVKKTTHQGIATLATDELLLETALWDQDEPYNRQCPMDGNALCATGCVPTSFAIAMRYHKYPKYGIGQTDAYTTEIKGIYVDSRDLSQHEYDWDSMLLDYTNSYTDEQATAVATLMADIGAMLVSDYTSYETGTSIGIPTPADFYEHFNYSSTMYYAAAYNYSDEDWRALMKKEIRTNGPVSYGSVLMGHQFILDGYDSSDYLHVNWGWSGLANGYYLLPDILTGYDIQSAYLNFIPDDGKQTTTLQIYGTGLVADTDIFATNVTFNMSSIQIVNVGSVNFDGNIAYGLTDSDGNIKEIISSQNQISGLKPYAYTTLRSTTACTITNMIEAGDCIRLCFKDDEATDWRVMETYSMTTTYKIVFTEDIIGEPQECALLMYNPGLELSIDEFYEGGCSFTADYLICNMSGNTVKTNVCLGLTDSEGNLKEWISEIIPIEIQNRFTSSGSELPCTITNGVKVGDFICLFYQGFNNDDDTWRAINSYYYNACPVEVEITNVIPTGIDTESSEPDDNEAIYTIQGIRVNDVTQPGIYIKNGKKVLIK